MKHCNLQTETGWHSAYCLDRCVLCTDFCIYFKQDVEDPLLLPTQSNDQLDFSTADSAPDGGFSF
jgi:hypothetical protein